MSALGDLGARMDAYANACRRDADILDGVAQDIADALARAMELQGGLPTDRLAGRCGFAVDRAHDAMSTLRSVAAELRRGVSR